MAGKHNLKIDQGSTWSKVITWKDESEARINLTGYSAKLQIRDRLGGNVLIEISTENDQIRLQEDQDSEHATIGVIHLTILPEDTESMTRFTGVYDLKMTAPDDTVTRLLEGSVTIKQMVTR